MKDQREVVIASAVRTPIGKFQGTLATIPAVELGGIVIREAVKRAGINPGDVAEVLMGNVVQAGLGQAPARQAAIKGGLPPTVGATTINKVCGSGLKAVMLAAAMIKVGDGDIFIAGGMESMNMGPYMLPKARFGYRLGHGELIDATVHDGLWCAIQDWHMGNAAEFIAQQYDLKREELDEFALSSHQKAIKAIDEGKFEAEIVPVEVPQRKVTGLLPSRAKSRPPGSAGEQARQGRPILFDTDETPRRDTSLEALARLKPAFQEGGVVTAGNSPGITDGAAALVVMGADVAE